MICVYIFAVFFPLIHAKYQEFLKIKLKQVFKLSKALSLGLYQNWASASLSVRLILVKPAGEGFTPHFIVHGGWITCLSVLHQLGVKFPCKP
jgi:hypothetical protein